MEKETQNSALFNCSDRFYSGILFLITFLLYFSTSSSSVTFEDSGLFLSAIKTLGLPQPPGYPAYILLGHIVSYLPFGTLATKVHLLSNFLGASTVVLLFLSCRQLQFLALPSFFSALAVAISSTFWSQMIVAEVYPLHIFIVAALFYTTLRITAGHRHYLSLGLLLGIGLANHWPLLIMALPLIGAYAWPAKKIFLKNSWIWLGIAGVTAGCFYGFMMWRSWQSPAISFLGPIANLSELFAYINRNYYQVIEADWDSSVFDKLRFILDFIYGLVWREWGFTGAVLLVGCYYAVKNNSKIKSAGLMLGLLATPIVLPFVLPFEFNLLNQNVLQVFHLTSYFTAGLILAYGFTKINQYRPKIFLWIALLIVLPAAALNFSANDLRTDRLAENYARIVLELIPVTETTQPLVAGTDADVGPLAYVRHGLGERTDIALYTQSGVFFDNRIFNPFEFRKSARITKTEEFLRAHAVVYSTKSFDIFQGLKNRFFNSSFNGLLHEITPAPRPVVSLSPSVKSRVESALEAYLQNKRSRNWHYHREVIAARLCHVLISYRVEHSAFADIKSCVMVKARHLHQMKQHAEADQLYKKLIADSLSMIASERHVLRYFQLVNRLEQINSTSQALIEKYQDFAAALEFASPVLDDVADCSNSALTVFRSLEGRVTMSEKLKLQLDKFKDCKKLSNVK